ncbi:MAG TPA: Smr/MutS family protein [Rhizomicrobium sp.]|nr:Smr/MutS family protein [Rhizomicrobium sp.]
MTSRKRPASEEERELFEAALSDALPLKSLPRRRRKHAAPATPLQAPPPKLALPKKPLSRDGASGIDGRTADRLKRGLLEPQARLDLHGLDERSAHRALMTFLRGAKARKIRLVLIVTGKGDARVPNGRPFDLGLDKRVRGVLREMTPRWLREPGLAELIADTRTAHRRHGGEGALYVYLRKG